MEQYGYDEVNRLTSVDYGDGQTQSYAFDSMGNRASKTDAGGGLNGTEAYSYNNANMLLSRAGNPYLNDQNGSRSLRGATAVLIALCVRGLYADAWYTIKGERRKAVSGSLYAPARLPYKAHASLPCAAA